jgi:hypothetical protein
MITMTRMAAVYPMTMRAATIAWPWALAPNARQTRARPRVLVGLTPQTITRKGEQVANRKR